LSYYGLCLELLKFTTRMSGEMWWKFLEVSRNIVTLKKCCDISPNRSSRYHSWYHWCKVCGEMYRWLKNFLKANMGVAP
jgi:hypothetical protein